MEVDGQVGESVSEVKVWKAVGRTVAVETGRSDDLTGALMYAGLHKILSTGNAVHSGSGRGR